MLAHIIKIAKAAKPALFVGTVLFFTAVPILPSAATNFAEQELNETNESIAQLGERVETEWENLSTTYGIQVFNELSAIEASWANLQNHVNNSANLADVLQTTANVLDTISQRYNSIANYAVLIQDYKAQTIANMNQIKSEADSEKDILVTDRDAYVSEKNNLETQLIIESDPNKIALLQQDINALNSKIASKNQSIARWDEFLALLNDIMNAMEAYSTAIDLLLNAVDNSVGVYADASESVQLAHEMIEFENAVADFDDLFDVATTTDGIVSAWGDLNQLVDQLGSI